MKTSARWHHTAAAAPARESAAAEPAAAPAAPQATAAAPLAAPAAANSSDALAPASPPPAAAELSLRSLPDEPAQQPAADATQLVEAIAPAAVPEPVDSPAPATEPAETPQPAATARPAPAAGRYDHTFAAIMLAVALLVIVGLVLWAPRWRSGRNARAETPSAPVPMLAPTSLVSARTVVRHRRPPRAREQATGEIGPPRSREFEGPRRDSAGATKPSS